MEQLKKPDIIHPLPHCSIAGQSGSMLRLIYEFQNQFSLTELIEVYIESIQAVLPIGGIRYRFPLMAIDLQHGNACHPICNYQLNTKDGIWGDITIYRVESFSASEIYQFELITSLLVYPLKAAIIQASAALCSDDGGILGYVNPDLVDQLITREAKLAVREHAPMSIVLFNTDRFKRISETSGHIHSDKILYDIMQVMHNNLRDTDLLFRYHADTICLILRGITGEQAMSISERIRSAIDKFCFRQANTKPLHITVSAGIATLNPDDSLDSIFSRANSALLLAKKSGRNKCVLADGVFLS